MSFIDKNLLSGESVVFRTKKHLIIFFWPVVLTIFCLYAAQYMEADPILTHVAWAPLIVALVFWCYVGLEYFTSEFAVTNKRVMMREGFFNRHATEMRIATISQVNVDQNLLGQLLQYGTVSLNAFGATDSFTLIAQALVFQKKVNEQLDKAVPS